MKVVIECWKDHHYQWTEKDLKTLNDLWTLIHLGYIWHCEDSTHDEKITITIKTEE
jgi:hypothetical protein